MAGKFSPEFREHLVREVIENSRSVAQVARENGVGPETLRTWVIKARKAQSQASGDSNESSHSEREELEKLRKEVRELRMERDFLKKAAAFFATDHK